MRNHLFVIDAQNDFCDPKGSLFVPGADQDMARLGAWIRRNAKNIHHVTMTADSHHVWAIFHPVFWRNGAGDHPAPFTTITAKEVEDGVWQPAIPGLYQKALKYLKALDASGKTHTIWPQHCVIGTWGWSIHPSLMDAALEWSAAIKNNFTMEVKGDHPLTEHYSIFQAVVPDPGDPRTQINSNLLASLTQADCLVVAGEALNFCLQNSVADLLANVPTSFLQRIVVLQDCTSPVPVPGYDAVVASFFDALRSKGIRIENSTTFNL